MIALALICLGQTAAIVLLVFMFIGHLKDERSERWQLQERIREPKTPHVPISQVMETPKVESNEPVESQPIDEYDLVGAIDPPTPLRDEDNNGAA